ISLHINDGKAFFNTVLTIYFTSFTLSSLIKSTTIGEAMKSDEYVPIITPIINANTKPRIDSPPKINMAKRTKKVVMEVLIVRDSVLFNARLITPATFLLGFSVRYSLILSKTTTVSLIEYPTTVKIAAINA